MEHEEPLKQIYGTLRKQEAWRRTKLTYKQNGNGTIRSLLQQREPTVCSVCQTKSLLVDKTVLAPLEHCDRLIVS